MMLSWLRRLAARLEQARRVREARRAKDAERLAALAQPPEPTIDELMRLVGKQAPELPGNVLTFRRRRRPKGRG